MPVVAPTKASSVTSQSVTSTIYWTSWVCLGVWGFRFDTYDIVSGWWMVLGVFWFSASSIYPAHLSSERFRLLRIALVVAAAVMLIYGTYGWFFEILEGWAIVQPGHWLQLTSLPLRAVGASTLTAIALVPPLRRALGTSATCLLSLAALLPGLVEFGRAVFPVSGSHHHAISYAIELFDVCILPLIIAALTHRLSLVRLPAWMTTSRLARLWRGDVSLNVAFLWIYSPIICLYLGECAIERQLSSDTYSFWEHDTIINGARITYLLILVVGSLIAWRSINRFAPILGRQIRRLYAIVIIVSVTLAWQTAGSEWFSIGRVLTNSTKAALGSAYQFRLLYPGNLLLSGDITYGLADRLAEQLAAHPDVHRLWLQSDGGMIGEGSAAATIIAAHNLDTIVGDAE